MEQHNPVKPINREYKLWCVADNDGYVNKFKGYTGKNISEESSAQNLGLGGNIVIRLSTGCKENTTKLFLRISSHQFLC